MTWKFQSRNRETFDSNYNSVWTPQPDDNGFNLVIEKLLIPTSVAGVAAAFCVPPFQSRNRETFDSNTTGNDLAEKMRIKFQSRNRETFDSNLGGLSGAPDLYMCFNLVIEKLLIPTACAATAVNCKKSFNLVIEKLLIPTKTEDSCIATYSNVSIS